MFRKGGRIAGTTSGGGGGGGDGGVRACIGAATLERTLRLAVALPEALGGELSACSATSGVGASFFSGFFLGSGSQ